MINRWQVRDDERQNEDKIYTSEAKIDKNNKKISAVIKMKKQPASKR